MRGILVYGNFLSLFNARCISYGIYCYLHDSVICPFYAANGMLTNGQQVDHFLVLPHDSWRWFSYHIVYSN